MKKENIADMIQQIEEAGKKIGIEVLRTSEIRDEDITTVVLDTWRNEDNTGKDEETYLECIKIIELANHLNSKAVFYQIRLKMWEDEIGYGINLYFFSGSVMYERDITFPSYLNVEEKEDKVREKQLAKLGEAVERVFGNADFDPESIVENSLFPYLERNNIIRLSLFTSPNPIVEDWLMEVMGLENLVDLVTELSIYCLNTYENIERDKGDPNAPYMRTTLLRKLVFLVPYLYDDDKNKEQEITEKIERLDLAAYSKILEVKMMNSDPKDVEKIIKNFLNYRKKLGIRNPKVTKLEIDDYLRVAAYDSMVPRELLRNAMFDLANKNEYN